MNRMKILSAALLASFAFTACANESDTTARTTSPTATSPATGTTGATGTAATTTSPTGTQGGSMSTDTSTAATGTTSGVDTTQLPSTTDPIGSTSMESSTAMSTATPNFDTLDTNKDGWVSQSELPTGELSTSFSQYDADGDSRLSRSEFDSFSTASTDDGLTDDQEEAE